MIVDFFVCPSQQSEGQLKSRSGYALLCCGYILPHSHQKMLDEL